MTAKVLTGRAVQGCPVANSTQSLTPQTPHIRGALRAPASMQNSDDCGYGKMRLIPGQSVDIRVVYVTAPSLAISAAAQRYSRRGEDSGIVFESPAHDFTALLPIDGDGLVLDYPQLFRRAYPT